MGEQALDDDQQCSMLGRVNMRMDMAGDHSMYREVSSSLSGCRLCRRPRRDSNNNL